MVTYQFNKKLNQYNVKFELLPKQCQIEFTVVSGAAMMLTFHLSN